LHDALAFWSYSKFWKDGAGREGGDTIGEGGGDRGGGGRWSSVRGGEWPGPIKLIPREEGSRQTANRGKKNNMRRKPTDFFLLWERETSGLGGTVLTLMETAGSRW